MQIFEREKERKRLEAVFQSGQPEFLAVYGRRRVGKTHLISQFFKQKGFYFELMGRKGAPKGTSDKRVLSLFSAFAR